jgi:hypothetical protein
LRQEANRAELSVLHKSHTDTKHTMGTLADFFCAAVPNLLASLDLFAIPTAQPRRHYEPALLESRPRPRGGLLNSLPSLDRRTGDAELLAPRRSSAHGSFPVYHVRRAALPAVATIHRAVYLCARRPPVSLSAGRCSALLGRATGRSVSARDCQGNLV